MDLQLEAKRFTTAAALAKEVIHLLDDPACKVIVVTSAEAFAGIASELEQRVTPGRVKVVQLEEEEPVWLQPLLQTL